MKACHTSGTGRCAEHLDVLRSLSGFLLVVLWNHLSAASRPGLWLCSQQPSPTAFLSINTVAQGTGRWLRGLQMRQPWALSLLSPRDHRCYRRASSHVQLPSTAYTVSGERFREWVEMSKLLREWEY